MIKYSKMNTFWFLINLEKEYIVLKGPKYEVGDKQKRSQFCYSSSSHLVLHSKHCQGAMTNQIHS